MSKHNAPAVSYPVVRSLAATLWTLAVWCVGAVAMALWYVQTSVSGWRLGVGLLVFGAATLGAWVTASARRFGYLRWDGQAWCLDLDGVTLEMVDATPCVVLDMQASLLLKVDVRLPRLQTKWVWVQKTAMPERWLDIRRAVHAPARTSTAVGELAGHYDALSGESKVRSS